LLQPVRLHGDMGYSLSIVINFERNAPRSIRLTADPTRKRRVPHRFLEPIYNVKDRRANPV
jgi:hypothetical protein